MRSATRTNASCTASAVGAAAAAVEVVAAIGCTVGSAAFAGATHGNTTGRHRHSIAMRADKLIGCCLMRSAKYSEREYCVSEYSAPGVKEFIRSTTFSN